MPLFSRSSSRELELTRQAEVVYASAIMLEAQSGHVLAAEHTGVAVANVAVGLAAINQGLLERATDLADTSPTLAPALARAAAAPFLSSGTGVLRTIQNHANINLVTELDRYTRRVTR
jgi:hypothetical protein